MRKIFCIVLLCILITLSGCSLITNDNSICLKKMQDVIAILEENNKDELTALFAVNSLQKINNISYQINDLFAYYQGTSISINKSGGFVVSDKYDHGKSSKIYDMSYIVQTTVAEYSIAMRWCYEDDFDSNNIGIHYIYILDSQNNPYPEDKYWGDGTKTEGIFTNRLYGGSYTDLLMDCVVAGNKEDFADMFCGDVANKTEFEDTMNQLFDSFECEYDIANYFVRRYETESENGYEISSFYVKGFDIAEVSYKVCLRWCIQNQNKQSGAVSLYITKVQGAIDMEVPYWADELWTPGINIGKI